MPVPLGKINLFRASENKYQLTLPESLALSFVQYFSSRSGTLLLLPAT